MNTDQTKNIGRVPRIPMEELEEDLREAVELLEECHQAISHAIFRSLSGRISAFLAKHKSGGQDGD